jgi:hypothetical protein
MPGTARDEDGANAGTMLVIMIKLPDPKIPTDGKLHEIKHFIVTKVGKCWKFMER